MLGEGLLSRLVFLARFGLTLGARKYDFAAQLCERFLRGPHRRDDEHLVRRFAARAYEQLAAWDKALGHSQVVLEVHPNDFEMLRVAAESLMKTHRFDEAAHYARRMLEVNLAQSQSHGLEALFGSWLANNHDKGQWINWAKDYLRWFADRNNPAADPKVGQ